MVVSRNDSEVFISGQNCMALIDSGTLSEGFYQSMDPTPELLNMSDFNLNITGLVAQKYHIRATLKQRCACPTLDMNL